LLLIRLAGGRRGDLGLGRFVHLGIAQDVEHEQRDADGDRGVGDVEGGQ
jgi:hypothetical protein